MSNTERKDCASKPACKKRRKRGKKKNARGLGVFGRHLRRRGRGVLSIAGGEALLLSFGGLSALLVLQRLDQTEKRRRRNETPKGGGKQTNTF